MKFIVQPQHERHRTFKYLVPAMLFAEAARERQGEKLGFVTVLILDGRSPVDYAVYGRRVAGATVFGWVWHRT